MEKNKEIELNECSQFCTLATGVLGIELCSNK
jgi:hypothetical protein